MNHTQTYELNQWEDSDRILRTDFNADNQKLENALGAKLQYYKLKEVVTQETVSYTHLLRGAGLPAVPGPRPGGGDAGGNDRPALFPLGGCLLYTSRCV